LKESLASTLIKSLGESDDSQVQVVQWKLSKPNLLGTSFCVQFIQVFCLYKLN
jgi:hypothetical protein